MRGRRCDFQAVQCDRRDTWFALGHARDGVLSDRGAPSDAIPRHCFDVGLGTSRLEEGAVEDDPEYLAVLKHYRSLMPMAHDARKPVSLLRAADGAPGSHGKALQVAYQDFQVFTKKLLERIGCLKLELETNIIQVQGAFDS